MVFKRVLFWEVTKGFVKVNSSVSLFSFLCIVTLFCCLRAPNSLNTVLYRRCPVQRPRPNVRKRQIIFSKFTDEDRLVSLTRVVFSP